MPSVWAVADDRLPRLEWRAETVRHAEATWETLAEFVKLATADLSSIEEFCRRWGVLGVDETGQPGPPAGSSPITALVRLMSEHHERRHDLMMTWADGDVRTVNEWWEPLSAWHHVATRFRAILRLAADRQDERASDVDDIEAVLAQPTGIAIWFDQRGRATSHADREIAEAQDGPPAQGETLATRRDQVLEDAVNALVGTFPVRLQFTVEASGPPRLEVGLGAAGEDIVADHGPGFPRDWAAYVYPGPSLYSTLVLLVTMAVWWPLGLIRCSWCENPFPQPSERSLRRDRANFCSPSCRTASKMVKDRERARQRYARHRSTAGEPAQE